MRCELCGADLGCQEHPVFLRDDKLMVRCPVCGAAVDLGAHIRRLIGWLEETPAT